MSGPTAFPEMLACTHPGCDRKDLRGSVGRSMHVKRAHTKNWSTRKKPAESKG